MRLKRVNFVLCFLLVVLFCMPMNLIAEAKKSDVVKNAVESNSEVLSKEIYVSDIFELIQAVDNIAPWGKIFLKNDIDMCGVTLFIKKSLVIDLNGHNILVSQDSDGIVIESKCSVGRKKIIRQYSSDYVWDDNSHKIKRPFLGGDDYNLTVIDYEFDDEYNDDFYVMMQNGGVIREVGKDGKDGIADTWTKCSGENGETPEAAVNISSGVLSLVNMKVMGGNGGHGGNGAHYPWAHLPFSGGCGADGGDGGDGGSAIFVLRPEAKLIIDKGTKISAGLPGEGGEGGDSSSIYWFYKSKPGVNGKPGKTKPGIEYNYKK